MSSLVLYAMHNCCTVTVLAKHIHKSFMHVCTHNCDHWLHFYTGKAIAAGMSIHRYVSVPLLCCSSLHLASIYGQLIGIIFIVNVPSL